MRDQNHVVQGKKPSDWFDVFLIIFEKVLKNKSQMAKRKLFGFF